ncbi:MAG TPA: hypothetical protein VGP94_15750 [Tepidisphaeraceae bacterium]|jgi:type II secretory pathway pseudopilin PulG|nr:hypothetical protein [Tepidisphaeraceae bacterium]
MLTRRKAFTTIEILLVVGVLVILIGIVVWGLKGAGSSAAGNSTRTTLQNLTGMSEELNRKTKLAGFENIYTAPLPTPPPVFPTGPETAPNLVTSDSKNTDRFGAAVRRTGIVMNRLASIPDNKKSLQNLPSDQLMSIPSGAPGVPEAAVVLDGWKNPILFVPAAGLENVRFKSGITPPQPAGAAAPVIRSPDNRPFWASAGPDGSFSNGDDNIYSFEH